ncbi:MAG: GNAT family N-acetyltransferase [Defluviitaleaceae bacterium]|nr:GNAT family N-acetyltransferase [Defluviitaleaceae bacterium]
MKLISKEKRSSIAPLFEGWGDVGILSYLQGHGGQAWADDEDAPTVANITSMDVCYVAGNADSPQAKELLRQIPIGNELQVHSEAWHKAVAEAIPNTTYPITRYKFKKDAALFDKDKLRAYIQALPKEYTIAPIDEAMFNHFPTEVFDCHCTQFASFAEFEKYGAGFVVLHQGEPVCAASSFTYSDSLIDVQIDTAEDHQRKGLATACAANLILACLERGIFPCWDADCDESRHLAEKLGYQLERECETYEIDMHRLVYKTNSLFKDAGFDYAICGGFALDMFAGKTIREHGDFDVLVFKEEKQRAVQFLQERGWQVFGRFAENGAVWQFLFYKVDDMADGFWDGCKNFWAVKADALPQVLQKIDRVQGARPEVFTYQTRQWLVKDELEFIELECDTREGGDYVARENPRITRPLEKAILQRDSIPYLAPEVILFYKSDKYSSENAYAKPRTAADFEAIMPMLPAESKEWLVNAIRATYPGGYEWLEGVIK